MTETPERVRQAIFLSRHRGGEQCRHGRVGEIPRGPAPETLPRLETTATPRITCATSRVAATSGVAVAPSITSGCDIRAEFVVFRPRHPRFTSASSRLALWPTRRGQD